MVWILREGPLNLLRSLSALSNTTPSTDQLACCNLSANGVGSPFIANSGVRPIGFVDDVLAMSVGASANRRSRGHGLCSDGELFAASGIVTSAATAFRFSFGRFFAASSGRSASTALGKRQRMAKSRARRFKKMAEVRRVTHRGCKRTLHELVGGDNSFGKNPDLVKRYNNFRSAYWKGRAQQHLKGESNEQHNQQLYNPIWGCGRIVGPFGPVRSSRVQSIRKKKGPRDAGAHRWLREERQDVRHLRQDPAPLGGKRGRAAAEDLRSQVRALRRRGPGQGDGDGAKRRILQGHRGSARHRKPRCCTLLAERRRNEGGADERPGKNA